VVVPERLLVQDDPVIIDRQAQLKRELVCRWLAIGLEFGQFIVSCVASGLQTELNSKPFLLLAWRLTLIKPLICSVV
jgi:hypothetical protein